MIPMTSSPVSSLSLRRPSPPQSAALIFGLFLLQSGCAANTPAQARAEKIDPYYQDAQLCRSQNPAKMPPAGADPAASVDEAGYLQCLTKRGYQQEAKTDPLLVALRKCQQQGTKTVSASGTTGIKSPSPEEVRQCLKLRGFPSNQFPPPPVAPSASSAKPAATSGSRATLKNVPGAVPTRDDRERVQTIYISRKTKTPQ